MRGCNPTAAHRSSCSFPGKWRDRMTSAAKMGLHTHPYRRFCGSFLPVAGYVRIVASSLAYTEVRSLLSDEHCPAGRQRLNQFAACSVRCGTVPQWRTSPPRCAYATATEIVDQTLSPARTHSETRTARSLSRDLAEGVEKAEAWPIVGMTTPAYCPSFIIIPVTLMKAAHSERSVPGRSRNILPRPILQTG